ncbi:hypothetical protein MCOR29_004806 [Pyricularia oryzae]|nr:hypothetical protein MCOR29_004806 [Pyricularia oryzae]KAI6392666.1 hypothetical protein MCOR23_008356 [Pyricularia oryzae]
MDSKKASYRPLMSSIQEDKADRSSFADDNTLSAAGSDEGYQSPSSWRRHVSNPVILLLMTLCVLVMALIGISLTRKPTDNQCARQLSMWSPALEAVEYVTFDFDDAFNSTSKYRGPPTPEVEEAWFNLTYKHAVEIPEDKIAGLNRSEKDHLAHVPADVGTGYVALLEVFHQLHCLNMIRMFTWWQAGKYPGVPSGLYEAPEDAFRNRMHIDHCLESLRIALMCWGDVTPLLVRLDGQGHDGRRADFDTHHKCRNWDKIESWMDENWTGSRPAPPAPQFIQSRSFCLLNLTHVRLFSWKSGYYNRLFVMNGNAAYDSSSHGGRWLVTLQPVLTLDGEIPDARSMVLQILYCEVQFWFKGLRVADHRTQLPLFTLRPCPAFLSLLFFALFSTDLCAHSPAMPFRSTLSNLGYSGHIILAGWLAYDGVMFWKRQTSFNQEYAAIQDMDSVGSHSSADPPLEQPSHHWGCGRVMLGFAWQVMLCTAMFLAGSVITAAILPRQHQFHRPGTALSTDRQCAAQLGVYSPLLEVVEYEEHNWTDPAAGAVSGYVGRPTREMERKWDAISNVPAIVIPFEKLPLLNRTEDPSRHGSRFVTARAGVPHPSSPGGYVGVTEVFHHLHCLNVLRQHVWRDAYAPAGAHGEAEEDERPPLPATLRREARAHADHCVDTLRQALMCTADVTPYLIYAGGDGSDWPPKDSREDFEGLHKCRRFEPLLKYVWDNGIVVRPQ